MNITHLLSRSQWEKGKKERLLSHSRCGFWHFIRECYHKPFHRKAYAALWKLLNFLALYYCQKTVASPVIN